MSPISPISGRARRLTETEIKPAQHLLKKCAIQKALKKDKYCHLFARQSLLFMLLYKFLTLFRLKILVKNLNYKDYI